MKQRSILFAAGLLLAGTLASQALEPEAVEEYWSVATGRAEKIVAQIELDDPSVKESLIERVAGHYRDLFVIHELRDAAVKALNSHDHGYDDFVEEARKGIDEAATKSIEKAHRAFVAHLTALAGAEVTEAVKDGLTYNVAPNTYKVYMQMLPELDPGQKAQIKAWLLEAREYAMDAGSSDEKHKWFGKYKGRINNYLSELGYDLKEAERAMWERMKQEKKSD